MIELTAIGAVTTVRIDSHDCRQLVKAFRDAAQIELMERGQFEATKDQLAALRERLGVLDCGLQRAFDTEDWLACGRIMERWWPQLTFSSFRLLSQRVVYAMPLPVLRTYPVTWHRAEYLGIVEFTPAELGAPETSEQVRETVRSGESLTLLHRSISAITARRLRGRHQEAAHIVASIQPVAEASMLATHSPAFGFCSYWFLQAGITCQLAGDVVEARRLYRDGWRVRHADELGFCAWDLASKQALVTAMRGDNVEARRWLDTSRELAIDSHWATPYVRVSHDVAALCVATDALDRERAASSSAGLESLVNGDEFWSHTLAAQARYLMTWGQAHAALDLVDGASRLHQRSVGDGVHEVLWRLARADALQSLGRLTQSMAELAHVADSPLAVVPRARLRLLAGQYAESLAIASEALEGSLWRRSRVELLLISAVAHSELGDLDAARPDLRSALDAIEEHHDLRALATVSRTVLDLHGPDLPLLRKLLRKFDRAGGGAIYPELAELVQLTAREMVVLQELSRGRTLAETAAAEFVSVNTVKSQVRSLYAKLGVKTRSELILRAVQLGFADGAHVDS